MSKAEHWFPLYIGDYLADTGHLSTAEHGAYLLLLMHQWRNGCVPKDEKQLAKITRQATGDWRRMSETVLAFFQNTPDGLVQQRLERERGRADENATRRTEKARKAANLRWKSDAPSMPGACSKHENEMLVACPTPLPLERDISLRAISPARERRSATNSQFADFWAAYPRKVGRGAAERAFAAAIAKGATVAEIAAGLNRQTWPDDPRFVPHPATWINQTRWRDDPDAAAPPSAPTPPSRPGKLDWLWNDMRSEATEFPDFNAGPERQIQ